MSIKEGIEKTRKLYVEKVYNILKNRVKTRHTESRVWSLFEMAHSRGFYLGEALLSGVDNCDRLIDVRGYIDALFDFVSPVEVCIFLIGSNQLKQNGTFKLEKADSVYSGFDSGYLPTESLSGKKYNSPSDTIFFVGQISDEVDPQCWQSGESAESQLDYKRIQDRRLSWRANCSVIFNALWRDSVDWRHLLNIGFEDVSGFRFTDHGEDFLSDILIKAKSRGFAYQSFFVNEIPLASRDSELPDCFTQAIQLFVSPAELYQMLDLTLVFESGKYSKPHDPKRIKMKS